LPDEEISDQQQWEKFVIAKDDYYVINVIDENICVFSLLIIIFNQGT
jgi:hypothetical protein